MNKKLHPFLFFLLFALLLTLASPFSRSYAEEALPKEEKTAPTADRQAEDSQTSGQVGTVGWRIDEKARTMVLFPLDGKKGKLDIGQATDLQRDPDRKKMSAKMFYAEVEKVRFEKGISSGKQGCESLFEYCEYLRSIDFSDFDTSEAESMSRMFYECHALEELDLSGFDTRKVTTMMEMFDNCHVLRKVDLSSFQTPVLENISFMFWYCYSLPKVDLSSFDTSNVADGDYLFYGCYSLQEANLSGPWTQPEKKDLYPGFGYADNIFTATPRLRRLVLGSNPMWTEDLPKNADLGSPEGQAYSGNWIREDGKYGPFKPAEMFGYKDEVKARYNPKTMAGVWIAQPYARYQNMTVTAGKAQSQKVQAFNGGAFAKKASFTLSRESRAACPWLSVDAKTGTLTAKPPLSQSTRTFPVKVQVTYPDKSQTVVSLKVSVKNVLNGWHIVGNNKRYYVNGNPLTGLKKVGKTLYLFDGAGNCQYGWHHIQGHDAYFTPDNASHSGGGLQTGLRMVNKTYYLFDSLNSKQPGKKLYGWHVLNNGRESWECYFNPKQGGGLVTGVFKPEKAYYLFAGYQSKHPGEKLRRVYP